MPRLVKKTAHAPAKVGDKFICMCGLSENQPFCDKSHLKTVGEDDKKLYWYGNGEQEVIAEESADCCSEECGGECKGECQGKSCGCSSGDCQGECGGKCKGDCKK